MQTLDALPPELAEPEEPPALEAPDAPAAPAVLDDSSLHPMGVIEAAQNTVHTSNDHTVRMGHTVPFFALGV